MIEALHYNEMTKPFHLDAIVFANIRLTRAKFP